jgi:hypothetical protein
MGYTPLLFLIAVYPRETPGKTAAEQVEKNTAFFFLLY